MNDITALAQRTPERQRHDWSQSVMHDCDFCHQWSLTVTHDDGARICASCCDAEYTSELEVANAALVEALEKAQQKVDVYDMLREDYGLCEKGIGLADFVDWQAKRITSLESRTVTVKLPPRVDSSNVPFTAHTWNCCLDAVEKCLASAGIQVIEGEG